jgi:hypothetical protein
MDPDEERSRQRYQLVGQAHSQSSPFVVRRRGATADFDERQKQLFDQALIAILTVDMPPDKLTAVLAAARDTTIQVFSGEMLAGMHVPNTTCAPSAADRPSPAASVPMLLSCTSCHGYSLALRGKVVQCDDCGTIQPTLENVSGRGTSRERNRAEDERRAELFDQGHNPEKQIVNVALSGTTLALMFHDGSVRRQTIPDPAILAISYLLRVLDTMSWAREALENRLLNLSKTKREDQ